jgi:hypothetical protein
VFFSSPQRSVLTGDESVGWNKCVMGVGTAPPTAVPSAIRPCIVTVACGWPRVANASAEGFACSQSKVSQTHSNSPPPPPFLPARPSTTTPTSTTRRMDVWRILEQWGCDEIVCHIVFITRRGRCRNITSVAKLGRDTGGSYTLAAAKDAKFQAPRGAHTGGARRRVCALDGCAGVASHFGRGTRWGQRRCGSVQRRSAQAACRRVTTRGRLCRRCRRGWRQGSQGIRGRGGGRPHQGDGERSGHVPPRGARSRAKPPPRARARGSGGERGRCARLGVSRLTAPSWQSEKTSRPASHTRPRERASAPASCQRAWRQGRKSNPCKSSVGAILITAPQLAWCASCFLQRARPASLMRKKPTSCQSQPPSPFQCSNCASNTIVLFFL